MADIPQPEVCSSHSRRELHWFAERSNFTREETRNRLPPKWKAALAALGLARAQIPEHKRMTLDEIIA
jgi:hypothetical protein